MIRRYECICRTAIVITLALGLLTAGQAASKDDAAITTSGDRLWVGFNGLLVQIHTGTRQIESTARTGRFAVDVVADRERAWMLSTEGGAGPSRITRESTKARLGTRSRPVPGVGAGLALWRGSIWAVVNRAGGGGQLVQFAPDLGRVRRSIPLPGAARGVAAWKGGLWIALDRQLGRYDGRRVRLRAPSGSGEESPFALRPRGSTLWVGNYDTGGGAIARIGNSGPIAVAKFPRERPLVDIAANPAGGAWVLSLRGETGVGSITLVGTTARSAAHAAQFTGWPSALTLDRGIVWVVRPRVRVVTGIDTQTGTLVATIRLPT